MIASIIPEVARVRPVALLFTCTCSFFSASVFGLTLGFSSVLLSLGFSSFLSSSGLIFSPIAFLYAFAPALDKSFAAWMAASFAFLAASFAASLSFKAFLYASSASCAASFCSFFICCVLSKLVLASLAAFSFCVLSSSAFLKSCLASTSLSSAACFFVSTSLRLFDCCRPQKNYWFFW
eukprot:TRINITY_DN455_c0_g1_i1.p1 TRINITY_DN455_c0_g1~~TRINITY_DN455_c0_g1_i1.p1  ORF type:complete len:179 (+),score=11.50 TRINITY_DN455_c0_g1_i1:129-665(+)